MDPHTQPAPTYTSRKSTRRNISCGGSLGLSPDSVDSVWPRGRSNAGKMDSHWIDLDLKWIKYQYQSVNQMQRILCPIQINIRISIYGLICMPNWEVAAIFQTSLTYGFLPRSLQKRSEKVPSYNSLLRLFLQLITTKQLCTTCFFVVIQHTKATYCAVTKLTVPLS